jgi:hypothetical protein
MRAGTPHHRCAMRRAFALLAVLAPALAAAQAPGQVTFQNSRTNPLTVNGTECNPVTGSTVTIRWSPRLLLGFTSAPFGGAYIIYGANQPPSGDSCPTQSNTTTNLTVGVVADQNPLNPGGTTALISTSALIQAAGKSCADEGAAVFICIQGVQGGANNPATNFGIATAQVTISTLPPPPPVVTSVLPADGALLVSWEPGAPTSVATADTQWIMLEAPDPLDPMVVHQSGRLTSSPARLGGLTNGVVYAVRAIAVSSADNPSDPSAAATGTPAHLPNPPDLGPGSPWQPRSGGSGGCGSAGAAGLVGLAALAGALALRPRPGSRRRC